MNLGLHGGVWDVSVLGARHVRSVWLHPVVFDWWLHRGRNVRLVVHPAKPLRGDHGAVVIVGVLLIVYHPAVIRLKLRLRYKMTFYSMKCLRGRKCEY